VSALQQLVETRLGQPLAGYVADRREAGDSWDVIAFLLSQATNTHINGETVRRWYS
jgi:hypothetical protein